MGLDLTRRTRADVKVRAETPDGDTYVTSGKDKKEAGRSMAYHIATGNVPAGSKVGLLHPGQFGK